MYYDELLEAPANSLNEQNLFHVQRREEGLGAAIAARCELSKQTCAPEMNTTQRGLIMQRCRVVQRQLMSEPRGGAGPLTPRLGKVAHMLEWVRIEEFCLASFTPKPEVGGYLAHVANPTLLVKLLLKICRTAAFSKRASRLAIHWSTAASP